MDRKVFVWLVCLLAQHSIPRTYCCEAITGGLIGGLIALGVLGLGTLIFTPESNVPQNQIMFNKTRLMKNLTHKVYGQHIVRKAVLSHIEGHLNDAEPRKALALSFHGPTGVGKNFISTIIAENMYENGVRNPFVHLISATKEFPHQSKLQEYKDQLNKWVEGNVTKFKRSMFIFDEVDKLPSKLLDALKPYIDYHDRLGGVSYRGAIFIFLSNEGGPEITQKALDHWRSGRKREDLKLSELERVIMLSAVNAGNKKGLWHSQLISSHLITAYIPFLPLEKKHVRECIKDEIFRKYKWRFPKRHDIKEKLVDEVIGQMTFYPPMEKVFSETGCKRISEKIDYVLLED